MNEADIARAVTTLDAAVTAFHARLTALSGDEARGLLPEEIQRRRDEARTAVLNAITAAGDLAQRAVADAEATRNTPRPDPLAGLIASELERAGQLRPFVAEDAERLPLAEFTARCAALLTGLHRDRAAMAVHLRYGRQRLESLPTIEQRLDAGRALADVLDRLERVLVGDGGRAQAATVEEAARHLTIKASMARHNLKYTAPAVAGVASGVPPRRGA